MIVLHGMQKNNLILERMTSVRENRKKRLLFLILYKYNILQYILIISRNIYTIKTLDKKCKIDSNVQFYQCILTLILVLLTLQLFLIFRTKKRMKGKLNQD